jgi:tetratricopeptide (TPR) repeat protein
MRDDAPLVAFSCATPRIGAEPLNRVFLVENHDQAYYIWRDAGVRNRTLVHIDAHHDMSWVNQKDNITIANFICPALKQAFLQEIFWVVPDATFQDAESQKPVLQHLKRILKTYPGSPSIIVKDNRIIASVLEKKLTICPLLSLPTLREAVLLDIDVDYLVIPRVSYGKWDDNGLLPWLWPSDLISRLHYLGIRSDLVTVAYSVEGGYTPLQWKYLGQELMLRLKDPLGSGSDMAGMVRIRQGAEAGQQGLAVIAETKYRQAHELIPESAAAPYRLARLLVNLGRIEEARQLYGQAVRSDDSYKGAYSSAGFCSYWRGELAAAEREFLDLLALDPSDAYCHLGLGLLAQKRGRWRDSEQHLRTALALNNSLIDSQVALGDTLAKLGRTKEAISAYEYALKLGSEGHKPLTGPILTETREKGLLDRMHSVTHTRLADLYIKEGAPVKAISALTISIACGSDGARLRLRLASLYWQQRQWSEFVLQAWKVIKLIPKTIWARSCRKLQRAFRKGQS